MKPENPLRIFQQPARHPTTLSQMGVRPHLPPRKWLAATGARALAWFRASVANPKFALPWSSSPSEFRIQSHTSNLLILVWFSDLKFPNADAMKILGTSNPPHSARLTSKWAGAEGSRISCSGFSIPSASPILSINSPPTEHGVSSDKLAKPLIPRARQSPACVRQSQTGCRSGRDRCTEPA